MSPRNHDNNKKVVFKELEKTISPVLVVNNPSLKPYIELFEYYPENIYQQPLGSLVGFFEIKEYSEDSAYIVNFLTSVLKKEYYVNPKRPVAESLDSALHKVNVALSELAKQGNVEWLGNLHAAICVLEKNNAHFSVAGKAKIFLYRNTILSDIGDGLAADFPEPHPLKTFVNVSSGRLEKDDRMLITSEDIFHILSMTEIKKNFQRFAGDKFVQLLKTALSNQIELIAAVIVQMSETKSVGEVKMTSSRKKTSATVNVFSEKTFAKTPAQPDMVENDLKTDIEDEEDTSDYTDKKTGHIYVQGETKESDENSRANIYWDMTKEKIAQAWYSAKNNLRRRFSMYKKQLAKKRQLRQKEKDKQARLMAEEVKRELEEAARIRQQQELDSAMVNQNLQADEELVEIVEVEKIEIQSDSKELSFREKLAIAVRQKQDSSITEEDISAESEPEEKISKIAVFMSFASRIGQKIVSATKDVLKYLLQTASKISEKIKSYSQKWEFDSHNGSRTPTAVTDKNKWDIKKISCIVPHFSKIKKLFSSFTYNQKIYTLLALVLIFIVPLFIVRWMNRLKPPTITQLETVQPPTLSETLAGEKNINLSAQKQAALTRDNIVSTLVANNSVAVITKTSIVMIENGQQKEYSLPDNSGTVAKAAFMKDLSLIFILTDQNKIISFSPVSPKFTENNINLPANSSDNFIGTYLTYLYVLNPQDNQIYRYPRATGGFGEKINWLKDNTPLAGISDMTIDDNIYCIQDNQVLKLFKGAKQSFTLEASKTPVQFDKIYTTIDSQSLYVLDVKNSRIVQYSKSDGSVTAQYFNEALSDGASLSVDEQNKVAYVSTSSELLTIGL